MLTRAAKILRLRRRLLSWFRKARRDLPWRRTHDPYRIVVSEIMLQQTQVDRVIPKYHAFLKVFPNWEALASAPQSEVVKHWHGLGYNRRALGLHRLAAEVVQRGGFPRTAAELLTLPGIGPYTAEAVTAFAFQAKGAAPVDTNIDRVIRRVFGVRKKDKQWIQAFARTLVPADSWSWNHALMDFGAGICTARSPRCNVCPLQDFCASYPCDGGDIRKVPQSKFAGSDRMYRGRIVNELRKNSVLRRNTLQQRIVLQDKERFARILQKLIKDGLLTEDRGNIRLR